MPRVMQKGFPNFNMAEKPLHPSTEMFDQKPSFFFFEKVVFPLSKLIFLIPDSTNVWSMETQTLKLFQPKIRNWVLEYSNLFCYLLLTDYITRLNLGSSKLIYPSEYLTGFPDLVT